MSEFGLGEIVKVKRSREIGTVTARAVYMRSTEAQFLIEYVTAEGRASEKWFYQSELEAV